MRSSDGLRSPVSSSRFGSGGVEGEHEPLQPGPQLRLWPGAAWALLLVVPMWAVFIFMFTSVAWSATTTTEPPFTTTTSSTSSTSVSSCEAESTDPLCLIQHDVSSGRVELQQAMFVGIFLAATAIGLRLWGR